MKPFAASYLDATLHRWKMKTLTDPEMQFKNENEVYSEEEVEGCRLVAKHNNGLAFLTCPLMAVYPDASFVALVRHPVALFESHRRRGITKDPRRFSAFFNSVAERMIDDASRLSQYHLIRFEDVLEDPSGTAERVQSLVGLDPSACGSLRVKAKPHFRQDGTYGSALEADRHHWLGLDDADVFFERSINRIQQGRLDPGEAAVVLDHTREVRGHFCYE